MAVGSWASHGSAGITVCLLGRFRVLKGSDPVALRQGGKTAQLLGHLALRGSSGMARTELLDSVWPDSDPDLARQSLNTLVSGLRRQLADALDGRPPVVLASGQYVLNADAGVQVDVSAFDTAVALGDRLMDRGDIAGADASYRAALELYAGDLAFGSDTGALIERERLRGRYLGIVARMGEADYAHGDYASALRYAHDMLGHDPCREEAHRLAMRCMVRLGARSQALRQYRVCRQALAMEYDATPEPATDELYRTIRLDPATC